MNEKSRAEFISRELDLELLVVLDKIVFCQIFHCAVICVYM